MSTEDLQQEINKNPSLLFRAKLHMPILQQNLASRFRLDQILSKAQNGRLTLVTAPAGFGKTTAVVKWVQQMNKPVAWFSIEPSDNNLKRFWHYLIAALDNVLPGLETMFSQYFQSAGAMMIEGVVTALIDELYRCKRDIVMILDDYHLIEENLIQESLDLFIKHLPDNAHLLIISRSRSPFSSERLQSTGHISEIKGADLQFTTEEIADFCQAKGIPCTSEKAKVLEQWTEGWAAGLYILVDSALKKGDHSRLFSGLKPYHQRIASYLTEEVINSWAEDEKEFMLKTSVLSSLSGPLCNALTGRTDGNTMLESLSRRNAFIISLDDEGRWYRYHHLFAEFLQKMLTHAGLLTKDKLHEQAGLWYEANDYFSEAVEYFIQGGVYERCARIIERQGREMLRTGDFLTLIGWLKKLPVPAIEDSDILCLTYAWALGLSDRLPEAEPWIQVAESRSKDALELDPERKMLLLTETAAFRGIFGLKNGRADIIQKSIKEKQERHLQGSIFVTWGLNFNRGEASLLSGMLGFKGYLSIIDEQYQEIYEKARRNVLNKHFGYIPVLFGEMNFERNKMDEAVPLLIKGMDEAETGCVAGSYVPAVITLARVMKARGDMRSALEIVKEGEKNIGRMGSSHLLPVLAAFKVRMSIETGDLEATEEWMRKNCLDPLEVPVLPRMYEYITLARVLIADKEYERCVLLLHKLLLLAQKENNLIYMIEILNLQAVVYQAMGQTKKAMEVLRQSLQMGEKERYERIFIEEGIPMAALLGRFIRWNLPEQQNEILPVSPAYVRKLIKSCREYCITIKTCRQENVKANGRMSLPQAHLTKREKEVLRLLDSELTNAEIAYTLDISVNTVKVNCTNLYRKLEVKNREQAVVRAKDLNILD